MERKIAILKPFFEDPDRGFQIRELARIVRINHTTIRQYLNKLVKEGILKKVEAGTFLGYSSLLSRKYINLKLYYNLENLWNSGVVEEIIKQFDRMPTIVLFGSYAHADDGKESDIDICILSNIKKEINFSKYEKSLNHKVSIHLFNKKEWEDSKKKNPGLVNSICNGMVLAGELEVV